MADETFERRADVGLTPTPTETQEAAVALAAELSEYADARGYGSDDATLYVYAVAGERAERCEWSLVPEWAQTLELRLVATLRYVSVA